MKLEEDLKRERQRNEKLAKELRVKEKALAETVALLVLRKKAHAIWGGQRKNDQCLRSHKSSRTDR